MQPAQDLTIDASVTRAQYKFVLENANPALFAEWAPKLTQKLQQLPELADVASDMQQHGAALDVIIDRATAARFGITPATIDNVLYDLFGQRIISTIYTQSNQYRVIMEADKSLQESLKSLDSIYLPSNSSTTNGQTPLSAIVHVSKRNGPLVVTHFGQFPATTISFNLAKGVSLGAAVTAIDKAQAELALPASFVVAWQGAAAAFQSSLTNELLLIAAAIATMYIVLGVLYESFVHPVTILSTLPSASVGALLTLLVFGYDLDIIAIIGIILLIGIVKKNAIMMIDFALEAERVEGLPPVEAIRQACLSALPSDPDDHHGRHPRRPAADAGLRRRLGTAPAARLRHRRRVGGQPGADPVHHAGDLSLFRPAGAAPARQARFRRGVAPGGSRRNEYLRPLHPAAGGDHPAHPRHRACGRPVLFPAAGLAPAAGRHSRLSPSTPACPARVRKPWPTAWPNRWSAISARSPT